MSICNRLPFLTSMPAVLLAAATLPLLAPGAFNPRATAQSSMATKPSSTPGVLTRGEAAGLLPPAVFFAGRSATIQARNSVGFRFPDGKLVLASLVDTSGYSSGVQERYQAYFITEVPLNIGGKSLGPGAYGCGFVGTQFLVMDIAGDTLLTVPASHDEALARPTPLQILAGKEVGSFRLYAGRSSVELTGAAITQ